MKVTRYGQGETNAENNAVTLGEYRQYVATMYPLLDVNLIDEEMLSLIMSDPSEWDIPLWYNAETNGVANLWPDSISYDNARSWLNTGTAPSTTFIIENIQFDLNGSDNIAKSYLLLPIWDTNTFGDYPRNWISSGILQTPSRSLFISPRDMVDERFAMFVNFAQRLSKEYVAPGQDTRTQYNELARINHKVNAIRAQFYQSYYYAGQILPAVREAQATAETEILNAKNQSKAFEIMRKDSAKNTALNVQNLLVSLEILKRV